MPKFFVKNEQITDNKITIIGEDVNHIKNVLRLKIDDNIHICNVDKSINYTCGISKINNDNIKIMTNLKLCKLISNDIDEKIEKKERRRLALQRNGAIIFLSFGELKRFCSFRKAARRRDGRARRCCRRR